MRGQFLETPYNRECPHHELYFRSRPERCPYCLSMSHEALRDEVARWLKLVAWVGVLGWMAWLSRR